MAFRRVWLLVALLAIVLLMSKVSSENPTLKDVGEVQDNDGNPAIPSAATNKPNNAEDHDAEDQEDNMDIDGQDEGDDDDISSGPLSIFCMALELCREN
ncbi:hypothetical protein J5N97_002733 [Dioscorea zingiberensis]|uniref:Uncharacterized protein n=1 Tax=Dioscorea zingiberensis TaxID=325984 RepID=A0A9D5HQN4_9LILI|nr:hypothetical protein J5N97_002733 [Dioscorea zingiberensis]